VGARTKARRHALDILFQSEVRDVEPLTVLAEYQSRRERDGQQPFNPYVAEIVAGTWEQRVRIDESISMASIGWDLDRMPGVDRNALRIGVWEILWRSDVPDQVAISEAVDAVRELSTDESPAFVNGVLASIMANHAGAGG
jgi:N utilization substance protein B